MIFLLKEEHCLSINIDHVMSYFPEYAKEQCLCLDNMNDSVKISSQFMDFYLKQENIHRDKDDVFTTIDQNIISTKINLFLMFVR